MSAPKNGPDGWTEEQDLIFRFGISTQAICLVFASLSANQEFCTLNWKILVANSLPTKVGFEFTFPHLNCQIRRKSKWVVRDSNPRPGD